MPKIAKAYWLLHRVKISVLCISPHDRGRGSVHCPSNCPQPLYEDNDRFLSTAIFPGLRSVFVHIYGVNLLMI